MANKHQRAAPAAPMQAKILPDLKPLAKPISFFKPDPENAKIHPEVQVVALMSSLKEFGQAKNVVALEDGTVIAGNGTWEAAKRLGWGELAGVTFPDRESAVAFALADNKTADMGAYDEGNLSKRIRAEVERTGSEELMRSIGFSNAEMTRHLQGQDEGDLSKLLDAPAGEGGTEQRVSSSAVRMVQLIFSAQVHAEFLEKITALHPKLSVTDAVMEVVRAAHQAAEDE